MDAEFARFETEMGEPDSEHMENVNKAQEEVEYKMFSMPSVTSTVDVQADDLLKRVKADMTPVQEDFIVTEKGKNNIHHSNYYVTYSIWLH